MSALDEAKRLCRIVNLKGGNAYIVGGATRDFVITGSMENVKDFDIEVFGVDPKELVNILSFYYPVDLVGQSFGVVKLKGLPIDVSIPRRESKHGTGHTGFEVHSDPHLTIQQAAERRDFTMNAVYYDPVHEVLIDPYKGTEDIERRRLEPVSEKFKEDPLRVLRAMQFIARFDMTPSLTLLHMCTEVGMEGLSKERIFDEWVKLLLKGNQIGAGIFFLMRCGWIKYFPELAALRGVPQDPEHHPEGDALVHTCHVMDAFAKHRSGDDVEDLVVGFAALAHDFGKATHTQFEDGKWKSKGHEEASVPLARAFMERMTNREDLIRQVLPLVAEHMAPRLFYEGNAGASAIRRLALRIDGRFDRLTRVNMLDRLGRPPLKPTEFPENNWLLSKAAALSIKDEAPKPIVMGRHLIQLGVPPGPEMGKLLNQCFEAQLDGLIASEADGLEFARQLLKPKEAGLVPAEEITDG